MFSLAIAFSDTMLWTLMFRTKEKAELAWLVQAEGSRITIEDDFGQKASFETSAIKAVLLEDMEQSKLAHVERALHQARMQAKGAEMAESDPVLKAARFRQGPAVLMPGMNGSGFPQR